jgi:hypothetical protein
VTSSLIWIASASGIAGGAAGIATTYRLRARNLRRAREVAERQIKALLAASKEK